MNVDDKQLFTTEFLDRYAKLGFRAMNKNDFEIMIFDLLRKFGKLKDKSIHEISVDLQIPETKVRRLAYASDLK